MRKKNFVRELFDGHTYGIRFDHGFTRQTKKVQGNLDLEEYDDKFTNSSYYKTSLLNGWYSKDQNVRWGLVRRFIESQVGRPWDKVWSDIKKMSRGSNKNGAAFLERAVKSQVALNAIKHRDGTVTRTDQNRYSNVVYGLYVDAADGILKMTKRDHHKAWKRRAAEREAKKAATFRKVRDFTYLVKDKGVWYEVQARPNALYSREHLSKYATLITRERGEDYYEVKGSRRTLSRKEKKELELL